MIRVRLHGLPPAAIAAVLATVWAAAAALAQSPHQCAEGALEVHGADAAVASRVCAVARNVRPLFDECGLVRARPVRIEIFDTLASLGGDGSCIALFDCRSDAVRLLSPDGLDRDLAPDTALRALPADRHFESLLVHELVHAALAEQQGTASRDRAVQEYVAYALQLESMSPEDRRILVDAFPRTRPVEATEITEEVYWVSPLAFAVNAWLHFAREGNGCPFVRRLITGDGALGKAAR